MITLTVSQLNRYIKAVLDGDPKLAGIYIKGEISNFVHHYRSGHFYFTLKDEKSAVKAVMFSSHSSALRYRPENGMQVLVQANVSVYERDGNYQLYVTDMQPYGAGAAAIAFEQLKRMLESEGLFDLSRKKPLPPYPMKIGVVTSLAGAALKDIVNVVSRRWPMASIILSPAQVQGALAVNSLINGLKAIDNKADIVIIGRGGGSAEDLSPFNAEPLVRAVAGCRTPVISAVGHETDITLCDLAADMRAPTPSAAAELAVPSIEQVTGNILGYKQRLAACGRNMLADRYETLDAITSQAAFRLPMEFLKKKQEKLDFYTQRLYNNKQTLLTRISGELAARSAMLDSLSPLRVLERGYAAVYGGGEPVVSANKLAPGDMLQIRLQDGTVDTEVKKVIPYPQKMENDNGD